MKESDTEMLELIRQVNVELVAVHRESLDFQKKRDEEDLENRAVVFEANRVELEIAKLRLKEAQRNEAWHDKHNAADAD